MRGLWVVLLAALAADATAASCSARSGNRTTALVELYTSEGCDSCPAADRWLSSFGARGYAPDKAVPIALHVDYWDYMGWKDPYAKRDFAARQMKLVKLKRATVVYTPQVLLQGQDFRRWGSTDFDAALARINAQPPRAALSLTLQASGHAALEVGVSAQLLDAAQRDAAALYLAAYENKLRSQVGAGENRGRSLSHDYVVREWLGPIPFRAGLGLSEQRTLALLPGAMPMNSGVVAFVQNRSSGDVLQALMLPACGG